MVWGLGPLFLQQLKVFGESMGYQRLFQDGDHADNPLSPFEHWHAVNEEPSSDLSLANARHQPD
jgi:hypothetical protein